MKIGKWHSFLSQPGIVLATDKVSDLPYVLPFVGNEIDEVVGDIALDDDLIVASHR